MLDRLECKLASWIKRIAGIGRGHRSTPIHTGSPQHTDEIDSIRQSVTSHNAAERRADIQNQCVPGLLLHHATKE
jgi:hypothetical protein